MAKGLDEKDLKILRILQENARVSYSHMSKSLGISEAAVYSRVQKLVREGYIRRFQAVLNEEKLGKSIVAFVSIKSIPTQYESLLEKLTEIPEIQEVHDVTGDFYCLLKIRTDNKESLTRILDKIGRIEGVISTETRIVLRTLKETNMIYL